MSLLPKMAEEAPLAMRLLQPVARVGYQGLTSGLVNKAQGGEFGTGAGVGLLGGVGGEAMKAAAPYLAESALGTRMARSGRRTRRRRDWQGCAGRDARAVAGDSARVRQRSDKYTFWRKAGTAGRREPAASTGNQGFFATTV